MRWRISVSSVWLGQLLVKAVEHAALLRVEQVGVTVQQLVHHHAPRWWRALMMASRSAVGLAPRILHPPKVGPQADRQRVDLADAFHGLLGRELAAMRPACTSSSCCCRSAMRRCKCSVRLCGSGLSAAARLSISRCTTRQARCGGGHHPPIELRNEAQRGFQRIGLKHPPLTLYHQPAPYPLAHLAPGLAQGVVAVDLKVHLIGMHRQASPPAPARRHRTARHRAGAQTARPGN